MDLPRSSYFYQRARLQIADKYAGVRQAMADIFERNYRCYGYRRMQACLSDQSVKISEKVVRRLMKQACLVAATNKRRRYGSYMGEISPAPDNVLNRNFSADAPNEKWLTDITEFQIPAGKVYLSPMIDCFDGMVRQLVDRHASERRAGQHDAGRRHRQGGRQRRAARGAFGPWRSLSLARLAEPDRRRKAGSLNVTQGVLAGQRCMRGLLRSAEDRVFFTREWLSTTIEEFVTALDAYIRWYNDGRIKNSLGFRSPAEHRRILRIVA